MLHVLTKPINNVLESNFVITIPFNNNLIEYDDGVA